MTQRRRGLCDGGRCPLLRAAAGESGMILVLTLVILLVLSMIAGASLVNGLLQRSQARSEANAAIAQHATEAGVAAGMAWLSDPNNIENYPANLGAVPDPTIVAGAYANPSWAGWAWTKTLSGSFANGGSYATTIRFKRERRDRNGDGDCCDHYPAAPVDEESEYQDGDANPCGDCPGEVVLFNAGDPDPDNNPGTPDGDGGFGFPGSYFAGTPGDEGFPVIEIESVGTHGSSAVREAALFVARNHKAQVEGGFTSRAPVGVNSSAAIVSGINFDSPLFPGSCGADLPGIVTDVGVPLACDLNSDGDCDDAGECASTPQVQGSTCAESFDPNALGKRMLAQNPWDALGMTETDFKSLFTKDTTSVRITTPGVTCDAANPPKANLWYANENGIKFNNSSTCSNYQGVLVVHNEGFDPDRWATSCPDAASMASAYCSDPANKPAVFEMDGNVTWNGIVIADQVMTISGNPTVIGGVISLASGGYNVETKINGNITIKYSCDTVAAVTKRIGYKKKIGWQRLR